MRSTALAAILALTATAAPAAPRPPAPGDSISMEVNSWGRLINGWTIRADGSGEVRTGRQGPGGFSDLIVETRRLGPDPARYARMRAALAAAETRAGHDLPCGRRITDLPYGQVTWRTAGADHGLHFDSGCQDGGTKTIVDQLSEADRLVTGWTAGLPAEPAPKP